MIDTKFDDFVIMRELGKGGMGEVFLASHPSFGKVAIKIIRESSSSNIRRFLREAKITASLQHPNIVLVHQIGQSEDCFYIAMEYLEGINLENKICQDVLSERDVWEITKQICQGLQFAWTKKIVHRDVKPQNIFLTTSGHVKLMDFGISKYYDESVQITKTGAVLGTPLYLSPEQASCANLDCKSDIYSLGVSIYEALTKVSPFDGDNVINIIYKHRFSAPEHPRNHIPEISEQGCYIIAKMLQKDPRNRYQNYEQILKDIELWQQKKPLKYASLEDTKLYNPLKRQKQIAETTRRLVKNVFKVFFRDEQFKQKIYLVSNKQPKNKIAHVMIQETKLLSEQAQREDLVLLDLDFLQLETIDWINYLKAYHPELYILIVTDSYEEQQEPFVQMKELVRYIEKKKIWNILQVKDIYIADIVKIAQQQKKQLLLHFQAQQKHLRVTLQNGVIRYNNEEIAITDDRLQRTFEDCQVTTLAEETQKLPSVPKDSLKKYKTDNINVSLEEAMQIEGALAVALVDCISGNILGELGKADFDIKVAALGNIEVVKAKRRIVERLALQENIEDILITLDNQYHLIRMFQKNPDIFLYLVLDKLKINLTLARRQLKMIESELKIT